MSVPLYLALTVLVVAYVLALIGELYDAQRKH